MSKKSRRYLSPEKEAELIRQHLSDKKPVSEICEENDLQPSVFYTWMRQLLANAPAALVNGSTRKQGSRREEELSTENERLRARLAIMPAFRAIIGSTRKSGRQSSTSTANIPLTAIDGSRS